MRVGCAQGCAPRLCPELYAMDYAQGCAQLCAPRRMVVCIVERGALFAEQGCAQGCAQGCPQGSGCTTYTRVVRTFVIWIIFVLHAVFFIPGQA